MSRVADRASTITGTTSTIAHHGKHMVQDKIEDRHRSIAKPYKRRSRIQGLMIGMIGAGAMYHYRGTIAPYISALTSRLHKSAEQGIEQTPFGTRRPDTIDLTDQSTPIPTPPTGRHAAPSTI